MNKEILNDILKYKVDNSDDSDDNNGTVGSSSKINSRDPTDFTSKSSDNEEYDDDDICESTPDFTGTPNSFHPLLNHNVFLIDAQDDTILVGLKQKQCVYISGIFRMQIVKGGIIYNNIHRNASKNILQMWHPLSDAIPTIQSSYYAGWNEALHVSKKYQSCASSDLEDFVCVLRIQNTNALSIMDAGKSFPDVRYLWKLRNNLSQSFTSENCSYHILSEDIDPFIPLKISENWVSNIEKLSMAHKNSQFDMRILVLGGKNSGKSTFLRLLLENFNKSGLEDGIESEIVYFDTDPGQPEYSDPECVSLCQLGQEKNIFGQHLTQTHQSFLKEIYLGSSSPQDMPTKYLKALDELIDYFEEQSYMGTSLFNLPGWIKGFGMHIINHIIDKYKPSQIVILESNSSKEAFSELDIPRKFSSNLRESYIPQVTNIAAHSFKQEEVSLSKFQASQMRTFKMLSYMHTVVKSSKQLQYDFSSLTNSSPLQISFGDNGVQGLLFMEEFRHMHQDDIKSALEGTIVGLHTSDVTILKSVKKVGPYPILQNEIKQLNYISLALIHSIDSANNIMNVYIPGHKIKNLNPNKNVIWIMVRGKTDTPIQELILDNNNFTERPIPFISTERRKKHEHVWKIRKNVLRRGQHRK